MNTQLDTGNTAREHFPMITFPNSPQRIRLKPREFREAVDELRALRDIVRHELYQAYEVYPPETIVTGTFWEARAYIHAGELDFDFETVLFRFRRADIATESALERDAPHRLSEMLLGEISLCALQGAFDALVDTFEKYPGVAVHFYVHADGESFEVEGTPPGVCILGTVDGCVDVWPG